MVWIRNNRNLDAFKRGVARTAEFYGKQMPHVGVIDGNVSKYFWVRHNQPSDLNGTIAAASGLIERGDEWISEWVGTHEEIHDLQENVWGRNMKNTWATELEASAGATLMMMGKPMKPWWRSRPLRDLAVLKAHPASMCIVSPNALGIQASACMECGTYDPAEMAELPIYLRHVDHFTYGQ